MRTRKLFEIRGYSDQNNYKTFSSSRKFNYKTFPTIQRIQIRNVSKKVLFWKIREFEYVLLLKILNCSLLPKSLSQAQLFYNLVTRFVRQWRNELLRS